MTQVTLLLKSVAHMLKKHDQNMIEKMNKKVKMAIGYTKLFNFVYKENANKGLII